MWHNEYEIWPHVVLWKEKVKWEINHYFHLRRVDDFAQRPHQRSINSHQLLSADLVGFVQHHPHFVLVVLERADHLRELVWDVQLVGVEQEDDTVHTLRKPLEHRGKVVTWRERDERRRPAVNQRDLCVLCDAVPSVKSLYLTLTTTLTMLCKRCAINTASFSMLNSFLLSFLIPTCTVGK